MDTKAGPRIGIQGYRGSFNEQACFLYCADHHIEHPKIEYLYTADKVLNALSENSLEYGLFALANSASGVIVESVDAMGKYLFHVLDIFDMPVTYALLAKKGVKESAITKILSHPSLLDACRGILKREFPHATLSAGEGVLIDQAACASHLAETGSPDTVAVIAPPQCAESFGLTVLRERLDTGDHFSTFLWCKRRK